MDMITNDLIPKSDAVVKVNMVGSKRFQKNRPLFEITAQVIAEKLPEHHDFRMQVEEISENRIFIAFSRMTPHGSIINEAMICKKSIGLNEIVDLALKGYQEGSNEVAA